jgi:hypothetical protein
LATAWNVYFFDTVLGCLGTVSSTIENIMWGSGPGRRDLELSPIELSGATGIQSNENTPADVTNDVFIPIEASLGGVLKPSYIAASWEAVYPGAHNLVDPWDLSIEVSDYWFEQQLALLQAACDAWGIGETVVSLVGESTESLYNDTIRIWTCKVRLTTGDDVVTAQRRYGICCRLKEMGPDEEVRGLSLASNFKPVAGTIGIGSYASNNSAIVEVLQEIAQMRTEISVNNGAAMYSVSGGTRTEGE